MTFFFTFGMTKVKSKELMNVNIPNKTNGKSNPPIWKNHIPKNGPKNIEIQLLSNDFDQSPNLEYNQC